VSGVPAQAAPAGQTTAAAVAAQEPYRTKLFAVPGIGQGAPGRRSAGRAEGRGRTVGAELPRTRHLAAVHLPATVRAAAAHQTERGREAAGPILLRTEDLRSPVRRDREGNLVLFLVDASGSMAARARMAAVKGAVLSLLVDAYQRRDKVGLVTFRGSTAEVALPPTGSVEAAAARLQALATGGRTPLAAGLLAAAEVLRRERLRDPRRRPLLVIVTDGRATGGSNAVADSRRAAALLGATGAASIVVDCESGPVRLDLAARLAEALGGEHVPMSQLAAGALTSASLSGAVRGAAAFDAMRLNPVRSNPVRSNPVRSNPVRVNPARKAA
jgi:magnesium chelatase subunit D